MNSSQNSATSKKKPQNIITLSITSSFTLRLSIAKREKKEMPSTPGNCPLFVRYLETQVDSQSP